MYTKGDFHIHTTASDGICTPTEVVIMAMEKGVDIISITDHNTTYGIEEAMKVGEILGVKVIPGIELSTRYKGEKIHILSYFTKDNFKDEFFQSALRYIRKHDIKSLQVLLDNKIEVNKDCEKNRIDTKTGVEILKYFGGVIVLAHPVKIKAELVNEILNLGFDGIEAIYSKNSKEDNDYFKNVAAKKGWFYTAGSDFHTNKIEDNRHGQIGEVYLNKEEIRDFFNKTFNFQ